VLLDNFSKFADGPAPSNGTTLYVSVATAFGLSATEPGRGTMASGADATDDCPHNPMADAWPSDFDINTVINISDAFNVLPPYFGSICTPQAVRGCRSTKKSWRATAPAAARVPPIGQCWALSWMTVPRLRRIYDRAPCASLFQEVEEVVEDHVRETGNIQP
jgi:hypothetical protein